jgi:hypothetical protein
MSAPVLFLDFDGVLAWVNGTQGRDTVDPAAVAQLQRVVRETGCDVVVSSTWRYVFTEEELAAKIGVPVAGATPKTWDGTRGHEIALWLEQHPTDTYAIVDDDTDILPEQRPHFVCTPCDWSPGWPERHENRGLDEAAADALIRILSRGRDA